MGKSCLIDYHLHTGVTIDGKMSETQACERASALGLREIAFTNHIMLTQPDYTISPEAFKAHWERVQTCMLRFPSLTIRLGLEMDYYDGRDDEIRTIIQAYEALIGRPLDLVLGAVHTMKDVFFSSAGHASELYERHEVVGLYQDYFALATRAVRSRLFDVMAHPDLIKKYVGIHSTQVPFENYREAVVTYVEALVESRVGIEVNTKGYSQLVGEAYPSADLLGMYLSCAATAGKVPVVTLGSDAHRVEDVGKSLTDGAALLLGMGWDVLTCFDRHQPQLVSMADGN